MGNLPLWAMRAEYRGSSSAEVAFQLPEKVGGFAAKKL